jgi:hypothetical protein
MGKAKPKADEQNARKLRPRHCPKCLRGLAAEELRWRFLVGKLGFRSPVPEEEREVPRPNPIDKLASCGWNETRHDPRDSVIVDAAKLRRIDEGFWKLDPQHRAWASEAFRPRRRDKNLRDFFGGLENLALVWPTVLEKMQQEREETTRRVCQRMLRAEKPSPELLERELRAAMAAFPDAETWLVKRIAAIPKFGETIREEIEAATAAVVTAYEKVRTPTNQEKLEAREKERRKHTPRPRASVVDEFVAGGTK